MKKLCFFRESLSIFFNCRMTILISLIVVLMSSLSYSQPIMTKKEGFYFTLKANNYNILDNAIDGPQLKVRWFDIYVNIFDKSNYENYRNDEFKWPKYSNQILSDIYKGISLADFSEIYSYTCDATLGKWDPEKSSFPVTELFASPIIVNYPLAYNDFTISYSPTWNNNDIDFNLKMNASKAESFLASRKDLKGNINRKITAKIIYNVVNKRIVRTETKIKLGIYMHKIIFMDGATVLGEILPRVDYYDKVNMVKLNNGMEKIFYDKEWKTLIQRDTINASYYRIVNYKNGRIDGSVIDYFISGAKQMEGFYSFDGNLKDGLFTYYNESGIKIEEAIYIKGILNGKYNLWHPNGQKKVEASYLDNNFHGRYLEWHINGQAKEEVNYIQGKKNGCDYLWDEKGNCIPVSSWSNYARYYVDGQEDYGSTKCPCRKFSSFDDPNNLKSIPTKQLQK